MKVVAPSVAHEASAGGEHCNCSVFLTVQMVAHHWHHCPHSTYTNSGGEHTFMQCKAPHHPTQAPAQSQHTALPCTDLMEPIMLGAVVVRVSSYTERQGQVMDSNGQCAWIQISCSVNVLKLIQHQHVQISRSVNRCAWRQSVEMHSVVVRVLSAVVHPSSPAVVISPSVLTCCHRSASVVIRCPHH